MLLDAYTEFLSTDIADAVSSMQKNADGRRVEFRPPREGLKIQANAARLENVAVLAIRCNSTADLSFNPTGYVRQIYQTGRFSRISIEQQKIESKVGDTGYIVHNGSEWRAEHPTGYENLVVRAELPALERKLSAMTGADRGGLRFEQPGSSGEKAARIMKAIAFRFATELEDMKGELTRFATAEMEQSLLGSLLIYNQHNHSHLLIQQPLSAGFRQLRLIEEYIVANADQTIDVETLAAVSGVSARSVFRSFHAWRGCSPQEFVRRVRLNRAREMLLDGGGDVSVMRVALQCGFKSLGHFAREYRLQFGELPSETARRARNRE